MLLLLNRFDHKLKLPNRFGICSPTKKIYTLESLQPFVECIVIKDGLIVFTGDRTDLQKLYILRNANHESFWKTLVWRYRSRRLQLIRLPDHWSILPGLIDAHAHPLEYGQTKMGVNLLGCTSTKCIVDRIVQHIEARPDLINDPQKMIFGDGWDQTLFEPQEFPTAVDLSQDPLLINRLIILRRVDFHAYWCSKPILNRLNLSNSDTKIDGGEVLVDQDGKPTGIFLDNAMNLIDKLIPKRTDEDRLKYLKITAKEMLSTGLTGVHDAAADLETIEFYKRLDAKDQLPFRIYAMVNCGDEFCGDKVQVYEGFKLTIRWFEFMTCGRSVKLFIDGALGSWGAAMWEPYSGDTNGILRIEPKVFKPLMKRWVKSGFQVNSHAIGDRANSLVLDAYAEILSELEGNTNRDGDLNDFKSSNPLRLRIEHAQVLKPADIVRMGQMNILASVQPTHAVADMDYAEARLGSDRIQGAYAWKSLQEANVTLVLGSDFPVSPVSPFLGIHAGLSRKKPLKNDSLRKSNPAWFPNQRISSLQDIIKGFTISSSFSSFSESQLGSLSPGKFGDLMILDLDLMNDQDDEISQDDLEDLVLKVKVKGTILGGKLVYDDLIGLHWE
ncbi:uncharacterized protein MELLADRAFT_88017 [Melampsora larici-populina 98AG31]|uniref:Amidohydrolase 3 domain-containing protein n=1 Tax=Melampsora larici-populina (strain 98AG31 / pathotype 3-4-7) TaxID=747676 RepID=F4RQ41_MELLP|nr:uncharacterized protein MELLADRAFT_88017 [Melampsora larici-populina 98AG31]EGG05343.1 hypothetical protein MELLADRAFT_88017 [Melampsora larici-populina 98AG31]